MNTRNVSYFTVDSGERAAVEIYHGTATLQELEDIGLKATNLIQNMFDSVQFKDSHFVIMLYNLDVEEMQAFVSIYPTPPIDNHTMLKRCVDLAYTRGYQLEIEAPRLTVIKGGKDDAIS